MNNIRLVIKGICLVFLLMVLSAGMGFAQSVLFSKDVFMLDKEGLKEAKNNIKDGDFQTDLGNYNKALELLDYSIKTPGNVEMTGNAYYALGVIYEQGRAVKQDFKKSFFFTRSFFLNILCYSKVQC